MLHPKRLVKFKGEGRIVFEALKLPATAACLCKCALKFGGLLFGGHEHEFYFILLFTFLTHPQNNPQELIEVYFLKPEYCQYSRLPITRTFKGNRKRFELSGARRK